ncbi:MAG: metallophosphoesterase [Thaumarchaeota archaeon]|nr:metallophosphoesterase [Nitrososphaerota archaeon]
MSKKQHSHLRTIVSILMIGLLLPTGSIQTGFLIGTAAAITETQLSITPLSLGTHHVPEGSGIVASRTYPGIYWMIADSGNPASLYAIDGTGAMKNIFQVAGATNYDWEDIAIDSNGYIWIGDIGDNSQTRNDYVLYRVSEPNPYSTATSIPSTAYHFNYPNEARDGEALFVWQGIPHVVQKRSITTEVYAFPTVDPSKKVTLNYVGTFTGGIYITGADISADGRRLALINDINDYHWIIERSATSTNVADFFTSPTKQWRINFPNQQGEAIGFLPGNYSFVVASEQGGFWKVQQPQYDQQNSTTTTTTAAVLPATTTTTASASATYTLSFQGYDYDNKGEVSILVNNQLVASLPTADSTQNNNMFKSFSLGITKYVVSGSNSVIFRQNIYSSGVQNVQVTGPSGVLLSDSASHTLLAAGTSSVNYSFNTLTGTTTTTTSSIPSSLPSLTLSFQGYDYDNQGEASVLVDNQVVATLPTANSPQNNNIFTNYSFDISKFLTPGSNTLTFKQNIYSSGVENVKLAELNSAIYSNSTYYYIQAGVNGSVTYKFNAPTSSASNTTTTTITTTTTATTTTTNAAPFRFVVMGDSRGTIAASPVDTAVLSQVSNTANGFNPAFQLFTGDLCYDFSQGNCPSVWKSTENSNLLPKTVPIMGNHDAGDNTLWQSNFNIGSIVASFGGTRYSYRSGQDSLDFSFDYGNSHFVGMAVIDDVSSTRPSADQLNWLDADLTTSERTGCGGTGCALTFIEWHAPVYCVSNSHCSPPPIPPAQWATITNAHPSVTAIFHGHEHVLAYTHIDSSKISGVNTNRGYEEFIMGGAGAPLYGCTSRADWCNSNYGFIVVDVSGTTVTAQIYDMNGAPLHTAWTFNKNPTTTSTATTTTTTTVSGLPSGSTTYSLSFKGYDYDNKGEVTILVNNQVVATLPAVESTQNNNIFTSFSMDISKYIVSGSNTITFKQNLYSSGVQSVQVTGPSGVLLSDNTYNGLWTGGPTTATYNFVV